MKKVILLTIAELVCMGFMLYGYFGLILPVLILHAAADKALAAANAKKEEQA